MRFISFKKAMKRNPAIILYLSSFFLSGCATIPMKHWEYKPTGAIPQGSFNISELKPLKIAVMYPKDEREYIKNLQNNDEYKTLENMKNEKPLIYPDTLLIGRSIVDELRATNLFQRVDWAPKIDADYDFKIYCSLNSLKYDKSKTFWSWMIGVPCDIMASIGIMFLIYPGTGEEGQMIANTGIQLTVLGLAPLVIPLFVLKYKIDGDLSVYIRDPGGNMGPLRTIKILKKVANNRSGKKGDLYYDYALPSFAAQATPLVIQDIQNTMESWSGVQFVRSRAQRYYQLQDAELIAFEKELQRRTENKLLNDPMTKNLARAYVVKTSLLETLRQLEDKYMEEEQKLQDAEFKKYVDTTHNAWKAYTAQKNKEMLMTVLSIGAAFASVALSEYVKLEAQQAAGLGQYNIADTLSMTASTISALGYDAMQRSSMVAEVASSLRGEIAQKVEEDLGESIKKFRKIRGTIKEVHDQFMDTYLDETASFDDVMAGRWPKK